MMKYWIIFVVFFISQNICFGKPNREEQLKFISELAGQFNHDVYFYHWGNKKKINKFIKMKKWDSSHFKNFMKVRPGTDGGITTSSVAGCGLYVAKDPAGSSLYSNPYFNMNADFMEIKVEKGTPYIDLSRRGIREKLAERGLHPNDIYKLNPPLVIKYDWQNDWWVIKLNQGVSFRHFRGHQFTEEQLDRFWGAMNNGLAQDIFTSWRAKAKSYSRWSETLMDSWERNAWEYNLKQMKYTYFPFNSNEFIPFLGNSEHYYSKGENLRQKQATINWPYYSFRKKDRYLSSKQDMTGVCLHFGYQKYIQHEVHQLNFWNDSTSITFNSKGIPKKVNPFESEVIKNITCEKVK